jgi:hypothetical protein
LSKNKIYGDIHALFELYQFSNLKVLDISEQLVGSIPLLFKTDNRLFDSATYILPLPPKLEKFYAHKILVHSTPLANVVDFKHHLFVSIDFVLGQIKCFNTVYIFHR